MSLTTLAIVGACMYLLPSGTTTPLASTLTKINELGKWMVVVAFLAKYCFGRA